MLKAFKKDQVNQILEAVGQAGDQDTAVALPQPRFSRLIERAANAPDKEGKFCLPQPGNSETFKREPALLAQYVALKMLYERPFRGWMSGIAKDRLKCYIKVSIDRVTEAARTINKGKNNADQEIIKARVAGLVGDDVADLAVFLHALSAATASEMRVQNHYESDAKNARDQAKYIENLKLDVFARGFRDYLEEKFGFLCAINNKMPLNKQDCIEDPGLTKSSECEPKDWHETLYFILHLVPVDDVSGLLHQIRKWEILAGEAKGGQGPGDHAALVKRLVVTLELYLDMHDAKFEGGNTGGIEEFKEFFEKKKDFEELFGKVSADEAKNTGGGEEKAASGDDEASNQQRVQRRGLREIQRFGDLRALKPIFETNKIRQTDVHEYRKYECITERKQSKIADYQQKRETLHKRWVDWKNNKEKWDANALKEYADAVAKVAGHRHRAANVRLTDHIRLHRLMMRVLSRLLDYAGLWERDLYFVMLALCHEQKKTPEEVIKASCQNDEEPCEMLKKFGNGQIVEVVRVIKENCVGQVLVNHFGVMSGEQSVTKLRNNFAHFNMLRPDNGKKSCVEIDLTRCVNEARQLMAHDRKLKNAVSRSIIDLVARAGLNLSWEMDGCHQLTRARLKSRSITHLGEKKLCIKKGDQHTKIIEYLQGDKFVEMAAALFKGEADRRNGNEVTSIDLATIDWEKSLQPRHNKPGGGSGGHRRQDRNKGESR